METCLEENDKGKLNKNSERSVHSLNICLCPLFPQRQFFPKQDHLILANIGKCKKFLKTFYKDFISITDTKIN